MKILFFLEDYYLGGVDTFVINLLNNWPWDSDNITLICNKQHTGLEFLRESIKRPCKIVPHDIKTFMSFFELTKTKIIDKFSKFFLKITSPITRYIFFIYNVIAIKKLLLKIDADRLMVINGGYPGGDSCRAASIAWGILHKEELSIHNYHGVVSSPGWHIKLQENIVDSLVNRFTKYFVTVSEAATKSMSCRRTIFEKRKIKHIYNGLSDLNDIQPKSSIVNIKKELNIPNESKLCLMLGAYHSNKNFNKGHEFLFKALKNVIQEIPSAHLLICGYGSDRDIKKIQSLVLNFNIEKNVYLSRFRKDILLLLKDIDVLVVSSQVFESFCFAALEAMANQVPVVATNVGAIPEIVINGQGGYCIEKNDVDSYADHIIRLLKDDKLRIQQGHLGFQRYKDFFTASRMSEEYAKLIQNGQ